MKKILILSGKGGTGKTFFSGNLASLAEKAVFCDCDVDAANLNLLMNSKVKHKEDFRGGVKAEIDRKKCSKCGKCTEICRFNAIETSVNIVINTVFCEGCGLCSRICPENAIDMKESVNGAIYISDTKYGPLVHADLFPGEENSGKLVSRVKTTAKEIAEKGSAEFIIMDGAPGTACPVIASLSEVDLVVIVSEPTYSAMHDMERIVELIRHFKIEVKIVINKSTINPANVEKIKKYCQKEDIELLGEIPFSENVIKSISKMKPYIEFSPEDELSLNIREIWKKIS